jgi:hypothetical protein
MSCLDKFARSEGDQHLAGKALLNFWNRKRMPKIIMALLIVYSRLSFLSSDKDFEIVRMKFKEEHDDILIDLDVRGALLYAQTLKI